MIVVTGGAGFIGSNLVAALESRGERIAVCDWLTRDGGSSGGDCKDKWRNIAKRDMEDIVKPEALFDYLEERKDKIDAIFHLGAISTTTETDVDLILDNNARLSQRLWRWCRDAHIHLIYASSGATYGDGADGFTDDESLEGLAKLRPLNPYGWSKHFFDRWVAHNRPPAGSPAAFPCVGLKFFNVYGPNEYHKGGQRSVVDQIYPYAARNEAFSLFKSHRPDVPDGGQLRDFIWVGDIVKVMLWFLDHPKIGGLFNVGTGKARNFADLAVAVYQAAGKAPQIRYRDMPEELRDKYQYFTEADMGKLRAAGYTSPFTSLEDGVRLYVQDYLMQKDRYL